MCYALEKPLIGVSTLRAMALGMPHPPTSSLNREGENSILYCPMIDARRMEVYCAIFDEKGKQIRETRAEIIDENSFMESWLKTGSSLQVTGH